MLLKITLYLKININFVVKNIFVLFSIITKQYNKKNQF